MHLGGQLLGLTLCKLLCNCVDGATRDQNIHTCVSLPPSVTSVGSDTEVTVNDTRSGSRTHASTGER